MERRGKPGPASVWGDNTHAVIRWERVCVEKKEEGKTKTTHRLLKLAPIVFPLLFSTRGTGAPRDHSRDVSGDRKRIHRDEQQQQPHEPHIRERGIAIIVLV